MALQRQTVAVPFSNGWVYFGEVIQAISGTTATCVTPIGGVY